MANAGPKRMFNDTGLIYLGLMLALSIIGLIYWHEYHGVISYQALKFAWYELGVFDQPFLPGVVRTWRAEVARAAIDADGMTFTQLLWVLNRVGYFFVAVPVAVTLRSAMRSMKHRANKTRRIITARTLPRIMAEHAPAGIPVLYYGDLLNEDPPEQRWAQHPEEWTAEHGVLVNRQLDWKKCRDLFVAQLGSSISSVQDLQGPERTLFAVFATQVCTRGQGKNEAVELLEALNYSCHTGTFNGRRGYPNLALAESLFAKWAEHPDMQALVAQHKSSRTFLSALHKRACYSGDLSVVTSGTLASVGSGDFASTNFRWLKGMDRTLWYVLNCTGRKAPFIECAGVFAQTLWEQYVADVGYFLGAPYVDDAVKGLEDYLVKIGLINKPKGSKS